MDRSIGDDDLRVPQAGSSDPFTRSGNRWLGDIRAKDMTVQADMLRQIVAAEALSRVQRNADLTSRASSRIASRSAA
jgi:hypothetical protein